MIALIGHSNWPLQDFVSHLKAKGVTILIDVRSKPYSRHVPHFNQRSIEAAVKEAGLQYRWRGKSLGGFSENEPSMAPTLDDLVRWAMANPTRRMALMCAERDPTECHRFYWLGNYILKSTACPIVSLTVGRDDWYPTKDDLPPLPSWLPEKPWRVRGEGVALKPEATWMGYASETEAKMAGFRACPGANTSAIVAYKS